MNQLHIGILDNSQWKWTGIKLFGQNNNKSK